MRISSLIMIFRVLHCVPYTQYIRHLGYCSVYHNKVRHLGYCTVYHYKVRHLGYVTPMMTPFRLCFTGVTPFMGANLMCRNTPFRVHFWGVWTRVGSKFCLRVTPPPPPGQGRPDYSCHAAPAHCSCIKIVTRWLFRVYVHSWSLLL